MFQWGNCVSGKHSFINESIAGTYPQHVVPHKQITEIDFLTLHKAPIKVSENSCLPPCTDRAYQGFLKHVFLLHAENNRFSVPNKIHILLVDVLAHKMHKYLSVTNWLSLHYPHGKVFASSTKPTSPCPGASVVMTAQALVLSYKNYLFLSQKLWSLFADTRRGWRKSWRCQGTENG